MANYKEVGRIEGSPLNGLCERVCIEVPKVYDGCITRVPNQAFIIDITDISPANAVYLFKYISTNASGDSEITDLVITKLEGNKARIQYNVVIPLTVSFTDANGVLCTGQSSVTIPRDIVLNVPLKTLSPYSVSVTANLTSSSGVFTSPTTASILCCYVILTKIIVMVDLLVPTYGYCEYPSCESFPEEACEEWLNLPLFPILG